MRYEDTQTDTVYVLPLKLRVRTNLLKSSYGENVITLVLSNMSDLA